jgi:hypothetical protein
MVLSTGSDRDRCLHHRRSIGIVIARAFPARVHVVCSRADSRWSRRSVALRRRKCGAAVRHCLARLRFLRAARSLRLVRPLVGSILSRDWFGSGWPRPRGWTLYQRVHILQTRPGWPAGARPSTAPSGVRPPAPVLRPSSGQPAATRPDLSFGSGRCDITSPARQCGRMYLSDVASGRAYGHTERHTFLCSRRIRLAAGGIENRGCFRLNSVQRQGLSCRDLVGRYFMDHPGVSVGCARPAGSNLYYRPHNSQKRRGRGD